MSEGGPPEPSGDDPAPIARRDAETIVPKPVQERVEQLLSVGMQISHGRNQFIDKLDKQHVSTILANADKADERSHFSRRLGFGAACLLLVSLCWLFLAYGKTEHLDAVIAGVLGLAGGYGICKAQGDA